MKRPGAFLFQRKVRKELRKVRKDFVALALFANTLADFAFKFINAGGANLYSLGITSKIFNSVGCSSQSLVLGPNALK
jgi:hypothetical protein